MSRKYNKFSFVHCVPLIRPIDMIYDYCSCQVIFLILVAILMNLDEIILQVGCSDKIIQPTSSTFIHHFCINL